MSSAVKKLIKAARQGKPLIEQHGGFDLEQPELITFNTWDPFHASLKSQQENIVALDVDEVGMRDIDVRGTISGTDYRLSHAAFGDLCNFGRMPSRFVKDLAKFDEQLALDVVSSCIAHTFNRGTKKMLVLDTRCNRIEGIVSMDTYKPMHNLEVIEYGLSADKELTFGQGWTCGPHMRMTAVNDLKPVEPKKGDIVRLGMALEAAVNGDHSVRVATYNERLVCTNGMTRKDQDHYHMIPHLGDVRINVGKAVVQCAAQAQAFAPMMNYAAQRYLGPDDIKRVLDFVSNTRNGGNETIKRRVIALAQNEALTEGRENCHLTLWNFVNGCTACAHEAKSIPRKVEIENLGFQLLDAFQMADAK